MTVILTHATFSGVVAGGAGVAGLAAAIFLFMRKRKQKKVINSSSKLLKYSGSGGTPRSRLGDMESGSIEDPPTHLFTYEELEEATNCFNENRELGDGASAPSTKVLLEMMSLWICTFAVPTENSVMVA